MDPNSYTSATAFTTRHVHLDFSMNFKSKIISATATLLLLANEDLSTLTLDSRQLRVSAVKFIPIKTKVKWDFGKMSMDEWKERKLIFKSTDEKLVKSCDFSFGLEHAAFGTPLQVDLPSKICKNTFFMLRLTYDTHVQCSAAQWLDPIQTASKIHPYFFTQCQAIHARSLVPCQDTPSVKSTYSASITVPKPLTAIMSAVSDGVQHNDTTSTFDFVQCVPIPTYLIALAVGKLTSRSIGPRSSVWSEEETVSAGEFEFTETESFVATAEEIVSEYVWGKYDILLLPPSFPYGGMENPCLTFVTPTIVAGDKSLVDVVAHEISHSWAGNFVTSKNWQHFWLNEGFCVYIERKILGKLRGELVRQFKAIIGWNALKQSIETFGADNKLTCLVVDLNGVDPDDAFSSVPYEKGFNLLYYLECLLGGSVVFEGYLKAHFSHFAYQSITTDDWKGFLYSYIRENHPEKVDILDKVDWNSWLHKPGMPPVDMPFDTTLAKECTRLALKWQNASDDITTMTFPPTEFLDLTTDQKIVFLEELYEMKPVTHKALEYMWREYGLSESKNAETRFRFFQVSNKAKWTESLVGISQFLSEQGRMKFLRPLYRSLMTFEEGKKCARETFAKMKDLYHPIASQMVAKDLNK